MIVSDAPLISGDSGGPMFNLDGEVLGVNVSISLRDVKVNNTTKVNPVKVQMEALKKGEETSGAGQSITGYDNGIREAYETLDKASADKNLEGFLVLQIDVLEIDRHALDLLDRFDNIANDRQGFQSEDVHLQQADFLDLILFELGGDLVSGLVQRHEFGELLGGDHHPRGVHGGMADRVLQL